MKQVIDGKTYNTETAEEIGEWSNAYSYSDFQHCQETLYRTKKGAWFIAGSGGAMSSWAVSVGDSTGGGSGIRVLTESEALDWCEHHDVDVDVIEAHFTVEQA